MNWLTIYTVLGKWDTHTKRQSLSKWKNRYNNDLNSVYKSHH